MTLGESFSDMNLTTKTNTTIGVNIKRYITSDNSITLYNPRDTYAKGGISVYSKYMYRYFSEQEVEILKFLSANYKFANSVSVTQLVAEKFLSLSE
jgi:hypothetical protein